jgi:hypothetical protein
MRFFLPALALIAASSTVCAANVPNPIDSEVDFCMVVCPAGEIVFHVVVRDVNHTPVPNSVVTIDFCGCPGVTLCPSSTTDPYVHLNACQIAKITGVDGRADFAIRAGGGCSSQGARVYADGILLAFRNVASPDQDGNLMVLLPDLQLADSKRGSTDATADFDCDGLVADFDVDYVVPHGKHACPPTDPTEVTRPTWGALKTIYR